jgi:hypothetical protein
VFRLAAFISKTLASQPAAPRTVSIVSVAGAVLAGVDCIIYVVSGAFLVAIGWQALTPASPAPSWVGITLLCAGAALLLLVGYRIWQVRRDLQSGEAQLAEVTQSEAGVARLWGTPWGDLVGSKYSAPPAAKGTYRLTSRPETGHYYMQQRWALALFPGDTIWVLRVGGRDVLYAPASSGPGLQKRPAS